MSPEEIQKLWKSQEDDTALIKVHKFLLKKIRRELFWDEIGVIMMGLLLTAMVIALIFIAYHINDFRKEAHGWPWYFHSIIYLGVLAFLTMDHIKQKRKERRFGTSLKENIELALSKVEHQIWMYKNSVWWFITPYLISCTVAFGYFQFSLGESSWSWFLMAVALACGVQFLNYYGIRKGLEPRKEELKALQESLKEQEFCKEN